MNLEEKTKQVLRELLEIIENDKLTKNFHDYSIYFSDIDDAIGKALNNRCYYWQLEPLMFAIYSNDSTNKEFTLLSAEDQEKIYKSLIKLQKKVKWIIFK